MSKKIVIQNLILDVAENTQKIDYENAVRGAFESISPDEGVVNIVKVKLSDMSLENIHSVFKHLTEALTAQGLTNCVFIPLHPKGIQDITIDRLELIDGD